MDQDEGLRFRVLGPVVAERDGASIRLSPQGRRLLAVLLTRANRVVSTDEIIEAMWPTDVDDDESRRRMDARALRNRLGVAMKKLRDDLANPDVVVTQAPGYRLRADRSNLDSIDFVALVEIARSLTPSRAEASLAAYDESLSLWRSGIPDSEDSDPAIRNGVAYYDFLYDEFCQAEVRRLEERWVEATQERLQLLMDLGRVEAAGNSLVVIVDQYPDRESLWELWITALHRLGHNAEALRQYARLRSRLVEELGTEPGPQLRRLEQNILDEDLRPAPRLPAVRAVPLPGPRPLLFGRDSEIQSILRWTRTRQLITVTGLGGIGKTSVAIEAARRLMPRYADGIAFVDLSRAVRPDGDRNGAPDDQAIRAVFADGLGLRRAGPQPTDDAFAEHLEEHEMLVVLDNCEEFSSVVAQLLSRLLADVPSQTVIATSRIPLGIPTEQILRLGALHAPAEAATDPASDPAVQLFLDRAALVGPALRQDEAVLATIAAICHRLGGLPLAVELAARRLRTISVAELAEETAQLAQTPTADDPWTPDDPGRGVSRALDWSYRNLGDPAAQHVFRGMGVYAGGRSIRTLDNEAAGLRERELMGRLVEVGLVERVEVAGESRYSMLEPTRQYAVGLLNASDELAHETARHVAMHATLAGRLGRELLRDPRVATLIRADEANLTLAMTNALAAGDPKSAARIATAMDYYFVFTGRAAVGRSWVERVAAAGLGHTGDGLDVGFAAAVLQASLLRAQGFLASIDRDYDTGERLLADAVRRFDALADDRRLSDGEVRSARIGSAWSRFHRARNLTARHFAEFGFATTSPQQELVDRAAALYRVAGAMFEDAGRSDYLAYVLPFAGWNAMQSATVHPLEWFLEAFDRAAAHGLVVPQGIAEANLGWYHIVAGDGSAAATRYLDSAVSTFRDVGDLYSLAISQTIRAIAAIRLDDVAAATESVCEAVGVIASQGGQEWEVLTLGTAAALLAPTKPAALDSAIAWLDHTNPEWRHILTATGVPASAAELESQLSAEAHPPQTAKGVAATLLEALSGADGITAQG